MITFKLFSDISWGECQQDGNLQGVEVRGRGGGCVKQADNHSAADVTRLCFTAQTPPFVCGSTFHPEIFVSLKFCICCLLRMSWTPPPSLVEPVEDPPAAGSVWEQLQWSEQKHERRWQTDKSVLYFNSFTNKIQWERKTNSTEVPWDVWITHYWKMQYKIKTIFTGMILCEIKNTSSKVPNILPVSKERNVKY